MGNKAEAGACLVSSLDKCYKNRVREGVIYGIITENAGRRGGYVYEKGFCERF